QIGQASESRRLDPPLLMGLDEVTQICPVPLPHWLSDSGGKGIQIIAVVHGEAQLTGRWGDHGRQVVLDTSSVKMFLPGITDVTLGGAPRPTTRAQPPATPRNLPPPDWPPRPPPGSPLLTRGACPPVTPRLPRAGKNPAYRHARRLGHLPTEPAERAPYPVFV